MEMLVGNDGEDEEGGFLDSKEDGRLGEHRRFIHTDFGIRRCVTDGLHHIGQYAERKNDKSVFKDFLCITT